MMRRFLITVYVAVVAALLLVMPTSTNPQEQDTHELGDLYIEALPTPAIRYTAEDKQCLVDNVYHEARGEGFIGMLAVAYVTLNRTLHSRYPNTICEVVKQRYKKTCQFSWVCMDRKDVRYDPTVYGKALEVANIVLYNYHPSKDPTKGATMFHSVEATPLWMNSYKMTTRIRNHLFYRQPSKSKQ